MNPGFAKYPMGVVITAWLAKIDLGLQMKRKRFTKDAEEGMRFLSGPYDWLYGNKGRNRTDPRYFDDSGEGDIKAPRFKMTVNKTAEMVQIFGPVLYHQNPTRLATPREVPVPTPQLVQMFGSDPATMLMLQQSLQGAAVQRATDAARADTMQRYLNFTPQALNLQRESRWGIDEAIIKGCGCLWTEVWQTPTGQRMIGSFYDSVDNLVIDPDATTLDNAKWIARRRIQPVWEAERRFQLPPGTLKGTAESYSKSAAVDADDTGHAEYLRKTGQTQDLITYWDVFSKTGCGGRLSTVDASYQQELDYYGDYCYLAISSSHQFPLNLPEQCWDLPADQARQAIAQRLRWHTPFWADGEWPVSELAFHTIPGDPWPLSHLAPGIGELKFLNWAYSLMAGKLRITMRDFIAFAEDLDDDVREAVLHGADFEALKVRLSQGKGINELVTFLQHPPFNGDIYKVVQLISDQFDRRVGLNELMYGESNHQYRSAAEAEVKQRGMSVRPDDMAEKVESWMSAVARKEAIAAHWHLTGQDVLPVLGQFGADLWNRLIIPTDPKSILYAMQYRVEAGSVRKPNRERKAQNAKDGLQTLFPFFQQLAMMGITAPYNALIKMWGESIDLNTDAFMLNSPPPVPPPAPGGAPGGQPGAAPPSPPPASQAA